MSNEEKILAMLEEMRDEQVKTNARLDNLEADMRQVKADVQQAKEDAHQAKEDAHWTRIKIESDIDKKVQILLEGHTGIVETMATKEQLDKLREDLGLERYRIDVLAELRKAK